MCAYRRFDPPNTLMHITRRAPVLSATSSTDCIWIIAASPTLSALRAAAVALVCAHLRCRCGHGSLPRPVLDPVWGMATAVDLGLGPRGTDARRGLNAHRRSTLRDRGRETKIMAGIVPPCK